MDSRVCTKCGMTKATAEFHKRLDDFQTRCKACISLWYKKMYREDFEYRESQKAVYYEKKEDPEFIRKRNAYLNGRYQDDPDAFWKKNTERKYKITPDEYEWLLAGQDYCCALCGIPRTQIDRRLAIDHDHLCCGADRACKNCIRWLLCGMCNKGFVPVAEIHPLLRSDLVSTYLKRRPFVERCD